MSAASVISWMLARSPRPSAMSPTAASTSAWRVRAFRRSSRLAGTAPFVVAEFTVLSFWGGSITTDVMLQNRGMGAWCAAAGARLAPAGFHGEDG